MSPPGVLALAMRDSLLGLSVILLVRRMCCCRDKLYVADSATWRHFHRQRISPPASLRPLVTALDFAYKSDNWNWSSNYPRIPYHSIRTATATRDSFLIATPNASSPNCPSIRLPNLVIGPVDNQRRSVLDAVERVNGTISTRVEGCGARGCGRSRVGAGDARCWRTCG